MRTVLLFVMLGALTTGAGGCVGDPAVDSTTASLEDNRSYYFAFQGARVVELNDARGPCRTYGGCTLSSEEMLDLRMLGLSPEDERLLRLEAKAGRVVLFAHASLIVYVPPATSEHGVPAMLSVQHAWRVAGGALTTDPLYAVSRPLPPGMTNEGAWFHENLEVARINTEEHGTVSDVDGVPPIVLADVADRGGLLVQGSIEHVPALGGAELGGGTETVPVLKAEAYWRRWIARERLDCDWCPSSACTGPIPASTAQECIDGTIAAPSCQHAGNDTCGWVTTTCPTE